MSSGRLYGLKIIPMLQDDWLGTWAPRLRLMPMFQHPNVLRYFPCEWHRRGGKARKSVSYSAAYLTMEFCDMGRLFGTGFIIPARLYLFRLVFRRTHTGPPWLLQRGRHSPESSHRRDYRKALLVAGAATCNPDHQPHARSLYHPYHR